MIYGDYKMTILGTKLCKMTNPETMDFVIQLTWNKIESHLVFKYVHHTYKFYTIQLNNEFQKN